MTFMILMPLYKAMDASCVISLIDFHQQLIEEGHRCKFFFTHGFNAAKARRGLAKSAAEIKDEFDYVLWLDSDHIYRTDHLFRLIDRMKKENIPMLSGTYKLHGNTETAHGITDEKGFRHFTEDELNVAKEKDVLIDCQVVGFGFLLMTHSFLRELWNKHGERLFILDSKENCTEDVSFCRKVKEEGARVCFDPSVKVGHTELAVRY